MRPRLPLIIGFVVDRHRQRYSRADHQQPDSCAGGEARVDGRDHRPRAPARHPADAQTRSGREPGRLGAPQLRSRPSRRPPVCQRLARLAVPAGRQEPAVGLHEHRAGLPARDLQPAGERVHRFRLPSGVREERALLHRARRTRGGQPRDTQLHPAGLHGEGRDPSQRDHGVEGEQPGGEHLRGHPA